MSLLDAKVLPDAASLLASLCAMCVMSAHDALPCCSCVAHVTPFLAQMKVWWQLVVPMLLAMFVVLAVSFFWTQYANPGIRKLAGVKTLLRNAADEMTLVLTDVEGTQALSDWNPSVSAVNSCFDRCNGTKCSV